MQSSLPFLLPQRDEIIVDLFAGGGGASTGIESVQYAIVDIGMRMLQPRELFEAQGFPGSYGIERGADGRELSKASQVRMCGNSVCPPVAEAIVRANYAEAASQKRAA